MSSVLSLGRCRGLVAWVVLSSGLTACTRWQVQEISPQQVVTRMKPSRIRVTRTDSTRLEVVGPQVAGDSLIGTVPGKPFSMPLSDVSAVAVRKGNPGGTIALLLGIAAAGFAAFIAALAAAGMGSS